MADLSEKTTTKKAAKKVGDLTAAQAKDIAAMDKDLAKMANETTEFIADGADAISEQFTQMAEVSRALTPRQMAIGAGAVIAGVAIGAYVGYRYAEKRLSTKFEALVEEETDKLRQHYIQKTVAKTTNVKPDLEKVVQDLGYAPQDEPISILPATPSAIMQAATEPEEPRVEVNVETVNVFDAQAKQEAGWDYSKELKERDIRFPYVIHLDEWTENPQEFEKIDLLFYEGDEVLADDNDQALDHIDEMVGLSNLDRFGQGSGDPNTVFVRNEVREVDYEIARTHETYAHVVHGFDPDEIRDIRHENNTMRGRSRFDDD